MENEDKIMERLDTIEKNQILKWEVDDLRYVNGKEKRKFDSYFTKMSTFIIASISIGLTLAQSADFRGYSIIAFDCASVLVGVAIVLFPLHYWFSKNLYTTEQMAIRLRYHDPSHYESFVRENEKQLKDSDL